MIAAALTLTLALTVDAPRQDFKPSSGCPSEAVCRFVPSYTLKGANGALRSTDVDVNVAYFDSAGKLMIYPGEQLTLHLVAGAEGELTAALVSSRRLGPGELAPMEAAAPLDQPPPSGEVPAKAWSTREVLPSPDPGTVRLSFEQIPGHRDMLLVVENGLGQTLGYKAFEVRANGVRSPTTVCEAPTGKHSFEHWPYDFAAIELGHFRFTATPTDTPAPQLPCS